RPPDRLGIRGEPDGSPRGAPGDRPAGRRVFPLLRGDGLLPACPPGGVGVLVRPGEPGGPPRGAEFGDPGGGPDRPPGPGVLVPLAETLLREDPRPPLPAPGRRHLGPGVPVLASAPAVAAQTGPRPAGPGVGLPAVQLPLARGGVACRPRGVRASLE